MCIINKSNYLALTQKKKADINKFNLVVRNCNNKKQVIWCFLQYLNQVQGGQYLNIPNMVSNQSKVMHVENNTLIFSPIKNNGNENPRVDKN